MKELVELWVLHESGTCLFHYSLEDKVDPVLFGGFFSAINQYSSSMTKSSANIQDITMGNFLLVNYVLPEYGLFFVGRCKKTNHRKSIRKTLIYISKLFLDLYPEDMIKNWNGNTSKFENFNESIQDFFNNDQLILERMRTIF